MLNHPSWARPAAAAMLCLAFLGCGAPSDPDPDADAAAATAAPPAQRSQAEALAPEVARLLAAGNAAFAGSRFVAPPGDNAIEHYIAARQLDPANQGVEEAVAEVFPLGVAAAERALEAGDRAEAARIIALLNRVAPDSLPVRALRDRMVGRRTGSSVPSGAMS